MLLLYEIFYHTLGRTSCNTSLLLENCCMALFLQTESPEQTLTIIRACVLRNDVCSDNQVFFMAPQGFVRQGYCHACLDQNRDAVRAFGEGLKRAESDDDKSVVLSQIVSLGLNLAGLSLYVVLIL